MKWGILKLLGCLYHLRSGGMVVKCSCISNPVKYGFDFLKSMYILLSFIDGKENGQ